MRIVPRFRFVTVKDISNTPEASFDYLPVEYLKGEAFYCAAKTVSFRSDI